MVRSTGVYFPANQRFYAMGGRSSDAAGSDFTTPFEYNPGTNTWAPKAAIYPDNQVNNMACGVLTVSGTPQIYCVGGSAATTTVATSRVFSYNPVTDAITPLAAGDNWPGNAGGSNLPGGFTVFQNKLYILGGFTVTPAAALNSIYEFDPTLGVGAKWVLKSAVLPVAVAYVPTTTIGTLIFTGGGATVEAGVLTDSTNAFVYNPVADSISAIANIPRATGETRAVNVGGKMWVLGGGRTAPNPSNQVDIYDPGLGSWSTGLPFVTARRNFPADSDGSRVFLAGGYAPAVPINTTEFFTQGTCPTPTPSATPTATASATATPSATASPTATVSPTVPPTPSPTATASPSATCAPVTTVSYTGAPVAIPDNNTTGVNLVVAVSGLSSITDLDLRFDGTVSSPDPLSTTVGVNHSWVGDMIFRLTSPGGTTVTLYDRPGVPASTFGCSSNNLFALTLDDEAGSALEGQCPGGTDAGPLTGSFTPNNPLSAFDGQDPNGNWTLVAIDAAGGDVGTVRAFSLIFGGACGTPSPSPTATASPTATVSPSPPCPNFITLSTSQAITPLNSVSCNNGVGHTDNSYWRAFNMSSFIGATQYNINSVSFGIEEATGAGGTQPVTVRLYTTTNFPVGFPGSLTQIGTTTIQVPDSASGTVLNVPLVATFPNGGTLQLVMEVFTPDGQAAGNLFFIGSNAAPENGPSYLSAAACGITTPTTTAAIGFPDMHIVFNVHGVCSPGTPSPSPTPTLTPTPTATVSPTATPSPTITPPPLTPTPTPTPSASPSASPSPSATPPSKAINLSTRMLVQTGDNVGIGGFIITGNVPKVVLVRAIGPSLIHFDVPNFLADPVLELHGPTGFATITNNNWRDTQEAEIQATGIPPTNDLESAILVTLDPGAYTAVVRGNGNTSGVGLVEVYDLDQTADAKLANLSTRAFVSTGDNIVIAGFLLSGDAANGITGLGGPDDDRVIVRGIGPSLAPAIFPASAVLANPALELRDANGSLILSNNDWQDNAAQAAEIIAAGLAPANDLEAAIAATLPPGLYTALLAGLNNGTGIGVVEIYDRGAAPPGP